MQYLDIKSLSHHLPRLAKQSFSPYLIRNLFCRPYHNGCIVHPIVYYRGIHSKSAILIILGKSFWDKKMRPIGRSFWDGGSSIYMSCQNFVISSYCYSTKTSFFLKTNKLVYLTMMDLDDLEVLP